ncbi:MAG TPA: methylmalonyl-CoA mutase family protein [Mycobacteriales bacterium]|jgi:methylmalonyl-CoA mutase|nr:methylmalonyl-CoA mutase family protein [Mycobacteriales bacterium]
MTTQSDVETPAAGPPAATRQDWQRMVAAVLKKSRRIREGEEPEAPESLLEHETVDGLRLQALYTPDDRPALVTGLPGKAPFVRGGAIARDETGWQVRQRVVERDAATANDVALAELENGTTSIWLAVGGSRGVPVADLTRALDGVLLDVAPVAIEPHDDALATARAVLAVASGVADADLRLQLGIDPLGELARGGADARPGRSPSAADIATLLGELPQAPGVRALVADALPYHRAGASDVEELGLALATGVAYLRELAEEGVDPGTTAARLEFRYAATVDQFATIAKLRAARLLWNRVTQELGLPESVRGQLQHAVTSTVMMTRRDAPVNLLRTSVAAFAAGVGGADAVTVLPFDHALGRTEGRSDTHGRRLARNTQSLLVMEAHAARVRDPAGGSAYVEQRTLAVAEAAWDVFTEVERAGGMRAALQDGSVARRVAGTWQRRRDAVAKRTTPLLGVSEFPDLTEEAGLRGEAHEDTGAGLPVVRLAEDFEELRDRVDGVVLSGRHRPSVPVVVLGPPGRHTARLGFVSNLLAAGGIEAVPTAPHDVAEAAGGRPVAVVAGADKDYAESGAAAVQSLRDAGVSRVVVAGKAKALPEADDAVALGADALAFLTDVLDRLEVPR